MAPTASQVIESGDYLEPDFNPSTLTIPILLAIFIHHNIAYPSPHTKTALIKLFNDNLKPRAGEFKKQREKERRMQASSEDVFDGVTGARMPAVEPAPRRSTRRSSKTPEYVPEPPKPRRGRGGSATPSSSTARSTRGQPEVIEPKLEEVNEGEEEEEEEEVPQPQPSKRRPAAKPRQSDGNDSAWESNNPFQSGASDRESSTPSRQQKPKAKPATRNRNPATAPRISDLSSSPDRPPQRYPASRTLKAKDEAVAYMQPTNTRGQQEVEEIEEDEEDIDDDMVDEGPSRLADFSGEIELVPLNDTPDYRRRMAELRRRSPGAYPEEEDDDEGRVEDDEEAVEDDEDELIETTAEQINQAVSKKLADVQRTPKRKSRTQVTRYAPAPKSWYSFTWFKFVAIIAVSATSAIFSAYKRDSAYIGFCDHGSNTNLRITELQAQRQKNQVEAARCYNKLNFTSVDAVISNEFCSPLPLHTPLEANTCTPCPKFAFCTPDSVTCQSSYILKPHPLASLGPVLNGFPGLGSVAFPPRCVQDREKLKRIGGLVDGMEGWLAMTRGTRICNGVKVPTDGGDGGEAKVLGLEKESLREAVQRKTKRDAENADEIFERVLADLDKFGMIIKGTDVEGFEYVAAVRADFTLPCRIKVTAREWWDANRRRVYTFLVIIAGLFYLRSRAVASAAESRKVAGLVQEALDLLQEQEFGYHADPVTTTEPYIVPVHLRDLILKNEHSPQVRQRVWQKVAKVVEGNANVRTNEEEVRGEYTKVWRWVGSVGTPARSRRVSFADRSMRSLVDDDEE